MILGFRPPLNCNCNLSCKKQIIKIKHAALIKEIILKVYKLSHDLTPPQNVLPSTNIIHQFSNMALLMECRSRESLFIYFYPTWSRYFCPCVLKGHEQIHWYNLNLKNRAETNQLIINKKLCRCSMVYIVHCVVHIRAYVTRHHAPFTVKPIRPRRRALSLSLFINSTERLRVEVTSIEKEQQQTVFKWTSRALLRHTCCKLPNR